MPKSFAYNNDSVSFLQRIRKTVMILLLISMPVVFAWMSPVVIIIAGIHRTVNMGMIIFLIWFVSSLFLGRAYCSYACWGGAGQEVFGGLIKKSFKRGNRARWRIIRYIIFIVWIAAIFATPLINGGFLQMNPFFPNELDTPMQFLSIPREVSAGFFMYFGMQLIVFIILPLLFGNRAACHLACPMSVLGDIGARIGRMLRVPHLKLATEPQKCTNCMKCSLSCQMGLEVTKMVQRGAVEDTDCILCGECVEACPKKVIRYSLSRS